MFPKMKHNLLPLQSKKYEKTKEKYKRGRGETRYFDTKFNTQNCDEMENCCVKIWNRHIRVNSESQCMLPKLY